MFKRNYRFEKHQKDQARKQKQEEKRLKKLERSAKEAPAGNPPAAPETDPGQP